MPYRPGDIETTASILGSAFLVGVISQFLRQKTDETLDRKNIWWLSIAGGFSAMIIIGFLYEYTPVSATFLVSVAGVVGWLGVAIMGTLASIASSAITTMAEKKLNVPHTTPGPIKPKDQEKEEQHAGATTMGNQSE